MALRIGACLSLTGRHARFGRQAALGLRAWQALAGPDRFQLHVEDDGGDASRVAAAIGRLAAGCDLLLGPYSTGLARAAVRTAAGLGQLLWNHGGAGDDVQAAHPGSVVSVLTPAGRYAEPFVRLLASDRVRAPLRIVVGRGSFARQVAAGAERLAAAAGIPTARTDPGAPGPGDVLCAGSFEEDVAAVRALRRAVPPPRRLCAVAAGVREFGRAAGEPDGIYGVAQWAPGLSGAPDVGPAEPAFLAACERLGGAGPDYPAVQAAAAAALACRCAELAGSVDPAALWAAATRLEARTLFGRFRIDPVSGVQVGHEAVLVRWASGRPVATTAGLP